MYSSYTDRCQFNTERSQDSHNASVQTAFSKLELCRWKTGIARSKAARRERERGPLVFMVVETWFMVVSPCHQRLVRHYERRRKGEFGIWKVEPRFVREWLRKDPMLAEKSDEQES